MQQPTSGPGSYALVLASSTPCVLDIGAFGQLELPAGWYVYAGSAFGAGGVLARLRHHARHAQHLHWHIDYLKAVMQLKEVWYSHDPHRRECDWSACLRTLAGTTVPIRGFGSTDCHRGCEAHLIQFEKPPSLPKFRKLLRDTDPTHGPVHCLDVISMHD